MEELENPSYKYTSQIISSDGKPLGTYYPAPIPPPARYRNCDTRRRKAYTATHR